ncbi:MAG: TlpA disulfide reductase family protein, partial [Ignavibacteria bacterium]
MKIVFGFFLAIVLTFQAASQEVKEFRSIDEFKVIMDSSLGKTTLVNFWATWCPPCVKEFPELVKLYKDYKDKDFKLIFVSLDDNSEVQSKLIPFLKKHDVDFVSYHADFKKPEDLIDFIDKSWQGEIPYTKIYDKEGKLFTTFLG